MDPEQLRKEIDALGMTKAEFATELGVSDRIVRHWLAGNWIPPWLGLAISGIREKLGMGGMTHVKPE